MLENIKFERISLGTDIIDGGRTNCMIQDSQGFIWIGGSDALARYDGYEFKVFKHDKNNFKSIPDRRIRGLQENQSGKLIILTSYPLLIEYNLEREIFELINAPFFYKNLQANNMISDNSGVFWVGTFEAGIFKFDRKKNEYENFRCENFKEGKTINCNTISSLFFDRNAEKLYIGTETGGVNVYDCKTQSFSYLFNGTNSDVNSRCKRVVSIYKDTKNNLWFGTVDGLFLYKEDERIIKRFMSDPSKENSISNNLIYTICEDNNEMIWIGTKKGLNRYDPKKNEFKRFTYDKNNPDSIFYDYITTIICDKNNKIFFGTHGGGVGCFDSEPSNFYNLKIISSNPNNINANHVSQIFKDIKNNLWIGTYNGGFYKGIPGEKNNYKFLEFKELEGITITGITGDNKNNIWVSANKKSFCSINIDDNSLKFIDDNIFSEFTQSPFRYIYCQCRDRINENHQWLSVNWEYLILFDTENRKIVNNEIVTKSFKNINILYLFTDSKNNLWVGTEGKGLYKYDITKNEVYNFNYEQGDENSLSDFDVTAITEDKNNNLFFGTNNGGFNKLRNGENTFERYSEKDGLPGNGVNGLIVDDNNYLWAGLRDALVKFNIEDNTFNCFFESGNIRVDGFNTFACHKSHDGFIYLGTVFGINYFKPIEITTNPHIPNIVITDFQIFYESVKPSPENPFLKKSISYAKEIMLSYKESVITFEFAALIFNNPKRNQYAYKMEGFDDDWVYCGTRRTATYTNLDPGEYTFRVKGSNNDDLWNEKGTSIKVIITPPWYKTILFKSLVGLSVIGSIGSFYKKRIDKLNKEKTQQEEFTRKLIESQENERKRVAGELHDSLGQDLLIIKNKLLTNIKKTDDEKYKGQLQEISELTSATLDDVREISYNLRPYELDRLGLTKTITSMIERANSSTNINFTGNLDNIDQIFTPEVEINIYRIIQESLNNVIKHSEAKEVIVSFLKREKVVRINISDDGKGFDLRKYKMKAVKKGFGLKGIEERLKLMGGEFEIESLAGKGTSLEIMIPLNM